MRVFCNELRKYRNIVKLSQKELAERVGISRNALASIECCKSEPSYRTAWLITNELNELGVDVFVEDVFYYKRKKV